MEAEKVSDINNITWKRPEQLMKIHLLKKKKKALQARLCSKIPSTSNNSDIKRNGFSALENRINEKRKNPFRCELSKRFRNDGHNDGITSCEFDNSSDTTMFQLIDNNATLEKKHEQLQTSFTSILSKLRGEFDEIFESGNEEEGEKHIPLDWSLKSKMRLMSEKPFPWNLQLKTCEEASGITGFVRCVNSALSPEKEVKSSCTLDTSPNARFHQCCLVWQYPSFPWLTVFPRTVGRVSSTSSSLVANNPELRDCLYREWGESFRSLFQLVRALQCPYFYVCANSFTCLFRAAGICGQTDIHAFVTPTTSGFRQLLKNEDVIFSMPLKKSKNSSKRHSGDSVSLNSDGGYDTLDSAGDDHSQSTASQRSFTATQNEDDDEDDDDDDDDETAGEWLKSMGMADSEIKRLSSQQDKLMSEKVREIDQTPESLIYVEGVEVQALFNFLMNCKSTVAPTGPLAGIPPTLIAPVAFRGASLKPLKVQQNRVRVDTQSYYSIEIRGPILPHTIHNMCSLMKLSQEFSITFAHVDSTKAFAMAMDLSTPPPEAEEKPNVSDAFKSPVKAVSSAASHTPTKTPTSNALCKENLSDCGLPSSLVAAFCCPDTSRVRLIDTIRCNADGTYNFS